MHHHTRSQPEFTKQNGNIWTVEHVRLNSRYAGRCDLRLGAKYMHVRYGESDRVRMNVK